MEQVIAKTSLQLEKLRPLIMILGSFGAFIIIFSFMRSFAYAILMNEYDILLYDYFPYFNIRFLRIIGTIIAIFIAGLLGTNINRTYIKRGISASLLFLWFLMEVIGFLSDMGDVASSIFDLVTMIFTIGFFITTFNHSPFLSVIMIFSAFLKSAESIFFIIVYSASFSLPFAYFYIFYSVNIVFYFWLMIYNLGNVRKNTRIRENVAKWEEIASSSLKNQELEHKTQLGSPSPNSQTITSFPQTSLSGSSAAIPPQFPFGIPRPAFWCKKCNKIVSIKMDRNQIYSEHNCSVCGSKLLAWWIRAPNALYYQFIAGLVLMAGGMFAIMIENILNEGYIPVIIMMVLGSVQLLMGLFFIVKSFLYKPKEVPIYASTVLPQGIQETFLQKIIIIVVIAVIGGLIIFGFDRLIVILSVG